MTTFIYKRDIPGSTNGLALGSYSTVKIFYGGVETDLSISLLHELENAQVNSELALAIKGEFREEVRPFQITLTNSYQVELPREDNWETFLVNLFLDASVGPLSIMEYPDEYIISTNLEQHYIWCSISKKKDVLNKLEFGRYLPLEKPTNKRKSTSWIKGVYVNDNKYNVKFMQTSWDGEEGDIYKAILNSQNKQSVTTFLSIPIMIGWTEIDYRLDKEYYYRAAGQVTLNGQQYQNIFALKGMEEQDIPFLFDRIAQLLRTMWAESFINNLRRHTDKIKVMPIVLNKDPISYMSEKE